MSPTNERRPARPAHDASLRDPRDDAPREDPRRSDRPRLPLLLLLLAVGCDAAPTAPTAVAPTGPVSPEAPTASTGSVAVEPVIGSAGWTIRDAGGTVTVENDVLRVTFGYDAAGRDGWFLGGESSGGGGRDGGITGLYYKPTSATRNLVFRNGQWGSIYDAMDVFEAEGASADQADHDAPDLGSPRDARVVAHGVAESAGRVVAWFDFDFAAWRIRRTYTIYPWGDLTVHARVVQTEAGRWNYLGHRFLFAVSRTSFRNTTTGASVQWGANYQDDGESLYAWSDSLPTYRYAERIRANVDRNTVLYEQGRADGYSGFMLDDVNGNDPDIVVMNADPTTGASPFATVPAAFGGSHYVETALFSAPWAPNQLTHAGMTWFYHATRCCPVRWSDAPEWTTPAGGWEEAFHLFLRSGLRQADYVSLWQARARSLASSAPRAVTGATARLDGTDRTYHLAAAPGADSVSFVWQRPTSAGAAIDYRTTFVVSGFAGARAVRVTGEGAPAARLFQRPGEGTAMVVLAGVQAATARPFRITVVR